MSPPQYIYVSINYYAAEEAGFIMEGTENQSMMEDISEEEKRDILSLKEYIDELNKRQQWREHLRKQNIDLTSRLDESELRKLDSSLKKV